MQKAKDKVKKYVNIKQFAFLSSPPAVPLILLILLAKVLLPLI